MMRPTLNPSTRRTHGSLQVASCFCASYIGGSINYAATAQVPFLLFARIVAARMVALELLCHLQLHSRQHQLHRAEGL